MAPYPWPGGFVAHPEHPYGLDAQAGDSEGPLADAVDEASRDRGDGEDRSGPRQQLEPGGERPGPVGGVHILRGEKDRCEH